MKSFICILGIVFLLLVVLTGCNLPQRNAATPVETLPVQTLSPVLPTIRSTFTPKPFSVTATSNIPPKAYFTVVVVEDTTSEPVSHDQAQAVVDQASSISANLTHFGFKMIDYVQDGKGGNTDSMALRYINSHPTNLPNGIVIFSFGMNNMAKIYGGYSGFVPAPSGYRNTFDSPAFGANRIYLAIVGYSSKYDPCGYGGKDTIQSLVAIGGECRNHPGMACVQQNGYSMCSDGVHDLYASTPTYFTAATLIHEFMHSFSSGGDLDHYGTPQCDTHMGWASNHLDLNEAEVYNGLCPFVYQNFISSYQP